MDGPGVGDGFLYRRLRPVRHRIASTLIKQDWHLDTGKLALLNATMLGAAFLGALMFGRIADLLGRKHVYWLVAAVMAVAAIGSALAPTYWVLIGFRFLLGFCVGGDLSGERGAHVGVRQPEGPGQAGRPGVLHPKALGLIVGPLVALALLGAGTSTAMTWRILPGLGAVPAAAVIYLRRKMPESPRFQVQVHRRLQLTGFSMMALCFAIIGLVRA